MQTNIKTKIKICGLTQVAEVEYLSNQAIRYAGIVLFYPKSKRNNTPESAKPIISALKNLRKSGMMIEVVAVTVSPTLEQLRTVEALGFDIIQIHGELKDEILEHSQIPIFLAKNLSELSDMNRCILHEKIIALLFDGKIPGNGEVFDWSILKKFDKKNKMLALAGGLNERNVADGIRQIHPDIVDVSSGVEFLETEKKGKDPERIKAFTKAVTDVE